MNRADFGQRGEERIIGAPGGTCLCPAHPCKAQAKAGLFVQNKSGVRVAVCDECHVLHGMTWEEVLGT